MCTFVIVKSNSHLLELSASTEDGLGQKKRLKDRSEVMLCE